MKKKKISTSSSLAKDIAKIADDHKAEDIVVLDLKKISSFTDFFVICSGASDRQVKAIADSVEGELAKKGIKPLSTEGTRAGHWAVLDYGDVVVHVFYQADRDYYRLEKLWHDAPRIKDRRTKGEGRGTKRLKQET